MVLEDVLFAPGEAAAGVARATRSRRRENPECAYSRSSARGGRSPCPAGAWTAGGPGDGRTGRPSRTDEAAPRARRDGSADARLDAFGCRRRAPFRTLDRGDGRRSRGCRTTSWRRAPGGPTTPPAPGGR